MNSSRIFHFSSAVLLATFLLLSTLAGFGFAAADLNKYSEIHEAKNLVDFLSNKLHLQHQTYHRKYENLMDQTNAYLAKSSEKKDEITMLNKVKILLNDLAKKSSACNTFYVNFNFTTARQINIKGDNLLQSKEFTSDFTVTLQVNHRDLIDNSLALPNGNDLRVYFKKDGECQTREIDRILEGIGTTKTTVSFKLQEDLAQSSREGSSYFLVYGNKNAGKAKQDPNNVYLFYDDFSAATIKDHWKTIRGTVRVADGSLALRTGKTPTGGYGEVSSFVKHGYEWSDIEVELDFMEKGLGEYLGPFLKVENATIGRTSGWWFEYKTGKRQCTMRPFKNNNDGGWLFKGTLPKPLDPRSWVRAKYRVVGDRFSHWLNGDLIHDNVKVAPQWMIKKGTFGLGCHTQYSIGCRTFFDNIKITKFVPASVTLGEECRVDLTTFHGLGTSANNPATSCRQIYDVSLYDGEHQFKNGVYWIKTSANTSAPTFCDIKNRGWTLVGKISGVVSHLYKFWLIKNHNAADMKSSSLKSKDNVSCIDARYLATKHASEVMFSSGENLSGIGSKWVKWSLPEGREEDSFWTHSVGLRTVAKAKMYPIAVTAWNRKEQVCYQNKYGIMPFPQHGGSYPFVSYNKAGKTKPNDYCMAVGVQKQGETVHGWTQNGNGYDSPNTNSDWLNMDDNHGAPYVTVWLK